MYHHVKHRIMQCRSGMGAKQRCMFGQSTHVLTCGLAINHNGAVRLLCCAVLHVTFCAACITPAQAQKCLADLAWLYKPL